MQKEKILYTLVLIILALIPIQSIFGQTKQEALTFSNLTFEVSTPKQQFMKSEPIVTTFKIANNTNTNIIGHWAVDFDFPYIQVFIYHNGQKRNAEEFLPREGLKTFIPAIIKPTETHEKQQIMDFFLDQMFPEPGVYQLEFVLQDTQQKNRDIKEEIKSNLLTIEIKEPKEGDLEALNFMQNHGSIYNYFDVKRMIVDKQALKIAEEFLLKFGDTTYGDHVSLKVSEFYLFIGTSTGQFDPETGEIIVARSVPINAIKYLEKLSTKEDFVLADCALSYLVTAYSQNQEIEKAEHTLEILKRKYPNSQYAKATKIYNLGNR